MKNSKQGQSLIEYSLIAILVVGGILTMGPYVIRSINAHFKYADDGIKDSFSENIKQAQLPNVDLPACTCGGLRDVGCGQGSSKDCAVTAMIQQASCYPQGCEPSYGAKVLSNCNPIPGCDVKYGPLFFQHCEERAECCGQPSPFKISGAIVCGSGPATGPDEINPGLPNGCKVGEIVMKRTCGLGTTKYECQADPRCIIKCKGTLDPHSFPCVSSPVPTVPNIPYKYWAAANQCPTTAPPPPCQYYCDEANNYVPAPDGKSCKGCVNTTQNETFLDGITWGQFGKVQVTRFSPLDYFFGNGENPHPNDTTASHLCSSIGFDATGYSYSNNKWDSPDDNYTWQWRGSSLGWQANNGGAGGWHMIKLTCRYKFKCCEHTWQTDQTFYANPDNQPSFVGAQCPDGQIMSGIRTYNTGQGGHNFWTIECHPLPPKSNCVLGATFNSNKFYQNETQNNGLVRTYPSGTLHPRNQDPDEEDTWNVQVASAIDPYSRWWVGANCPSGYYMTGIFTKHPDGEQGGHNWWYIRCRQVSPQCYPTDTNSYTSPTFYEDREKSSPDFPNGPGFSAPGCSGLTGLWTRHNINDKGGHNWWGMNYHFIKSP